MTTTLSSPPNQYEDSALVVHSLDRWNPDKLARLRLLSTRAADNTREINEILDGELRATRLRIAVVHGGSSVHYKAVSGHPSGAAQVVSTTG